MENTATLEHLCKDALLKRAITSVKKLPIPRSTGDLYYDLVRTIAYQQLSGKAAGTIFGRFLDLFEDAYPHAQIVIDLAIEDMRAVGLSRQKANYIQNIATFFQEEKCFEKEWNAYTDEALIEYLTQIKGVGKWTVQMILMFTLERPDVFPIDDLGVRQAMIRLYEVTETAKAQRQKLTTIAENWRPYRTLACRYLWCWKDNLRS